MELRQTTTIGVPQDAVFLFIQDLSKYGVWIPMLDQMDCDAPKPLTSGQRFMGTVDMNNRSVPFEGDVLLAEPPSRLAFRATDGKYAEMTFTWQLEPAPEGTHVALVLGLRPLTWWLRLLERLVGRSWEARANQLGLDRLRRLLEEAWAQGDA